MIVSTGIFIFVVVLCLFVWHTTPGGDFISQEDDKDLEIVNTVSSDKLNCVRPLIQPPHVYKKHSGLLSQAEIKFYRQLKVALDGLSYDIAIKPRLADIVRVESTGERFWKEFSAISQKHVDFAVLDSQNLSVLLVIELDDNSHKAMDRMSRDMFVNRVLRDAEISIIHFAWQKVYSSESIRSQILDQLGQSEAFL